MAATDKRVESLAQHLHDGFKNGEANGMWPWDKVAESALAWMDGQLGDDSLATVASERDIITTTVGDCCTGSDPLCEAGCLVVKALKRRIRAGLFR